MRGCGDKNCRVSTGICGAITFGSGPLDDYGYWEEPCPACARQWEADHPGEFAWPRKRILWFDHREYFAEDFHYQLINGILTPLFPTGVAAAERFGETRKDIFQRVKRPYFYTTGECYCC